MTNIQLIIDDILTIIYKHLNLDDKFHFAITSKKLYALFNNYLLLDNAYEVQHQHYSMSPFLFQIITRIKVVSPEVAFTYIGNFMNLQVLDISYMYFETFGVVKNFTSYFPDSLLTVYVSDATIKEQFELALLLHKKKFNIGIITTSTTVSNSRKRFAEVPSSANVVKRIRTPSPVRYTVDKQLEALLLFKSRMKYATVAPQDFLPEIVFRKFPQLDITTYKIVINYDPFREEFIINDETINNAIQKLSDLLIHAVVINQDNNWVFVTQVEVYYKNKAVDDVAFTSKHDKYADKLAILMEKMQEGKGVWYELRFAFKDIEILATGGLCNDTTSTNKLNAFLGVAAPAIMALDDSFILFAQTKSAKTVSCTRMLRNYKKKASLNNWCFKSCLFNDMNFSTPLPLTFYESQPLGYVSISSHLIFLSISNIYTTEKVKELVDKLEQIEYWKDLGLEERASKEQVTERLNQIKKIKNAKERKPSAAKRLLIELLTNNCEPTEQDLLALANGILYPQVKIINKKKVKAMLKN